MNQPVFQKQNKPRTIHHSITSDMLPQVPELPDLSGLCKLWPDPVDDQKDDQSHDKNADAH